MQASDGGWVPHPFCWDFGLVFARQIACFTKVLGQLASTFALCMRSAGSAVLTRPAVHPNGNPNFYTQVASLLT